MLDSDSDDEVRLIFEELRHVPSRREDENGEPPRRRMRMDPSAVIGADGSSAMAGMSRQTRARTLAERARFIEAAAVNEIDLENPVPTSSTAATSYFHPPLPLDSDTGDENEVDVLDSTGFFDELSSPDLSVDDSLSLPGSTYPAYNYGSSPAGSILTEYSVGGEEGASTIDLDLDLDYQTVDSFESYNADQLSDVPVNRSPGPESPSTSSASEDSASGDGESLFGRTLQNDEVVGIPGEGGDHGGDANSGGWQRRRLQRRNAIVLENTDSVGFYQGPADSEHTDSVTVPSTTTAAAAADVSSEKLQTDIELPSEIATENSSSKNTVTTDEDENEVSNCIICCEPYANSGEHRLCCLKCGHTYGKYCIEKWVKSEARCPQCNAKASKKDIRVLYVRNLKALDTAERDRLRSDLEVEREMKRKLELKNAQLDQRVKEIDNKYKSLSEEYRFLKERVGAVYRDPVSEYSYSQPSTSTSNSTAASRSKPIFSLQHTFSCKDGECRVGTYHEWLNMLAVSQTVKSALYPHGSYGVKKINLLDMRETLTTPLHLKEIRDLEFNSRGDILLSVGLDKRAILTNCTSNITVQAFTSEYPLWSCAWSQGGHQHRFYAGTSNGQILVYDIRNGKEPVKTLVMPSEDKTPAAGMKFITPCYDKTFGPNSFNMTGLVVQKLTSVWFCEFRNEEVKYHQLPIEGSFLSVDFEPISRHVLVSTKASNKGAPVPSRQIVCNLTQYHSEVQQATLASCDIVQSYDGIESSPAGKMTRSSIFSPNRESVMVAAEVGGGAKHVASVWDISQTHAQQALPGREQVLDFVPCRVNNEFLLGSISANNLNIYKLKL